MLRQVLTYNFSNDETRSSFEVLLDVLGFSKADDQSTFVLGLDSDLTSTSVRKYIVQWSLKKDVVIEEKDFVQIFHNALITRDERRIAAIGTKFLSFDKLTQGLS